MSLEVIKKQNNNKITLLLDGSIDTGSIDILNKALTDLDYENLDLTLDFTNLSYITSVGLHALLICRKKLSEDRIRIVGMNEAVHEVFEMTGFLDYFPLESIEAPCVAQESLLQAAACLSGRQRS